MYWLMFAVEVVSFVVLGFAHGHVNMVSRWLHIGLLVDQLIGVSSCAPEDALTLGHVSSVTW